MKVNLLDEFGIKIEDVKFITLEEYRTDIENSLTRKLFVSNCKSDIEKNTVFDLELDKIKCRLVPSGIRITRITDNKNYIVEVAILKGE